MSRFDALVLASAVSLSLAAAVRAQEESLANNGPGASPAASATVPRLVRFSGTLPERRGSSPTSAASARVSFSIYEEQAGGAALWSEVQDVRHDPQGRYSVLLGAASSDGLPAELFSTAGARWLGVQVEGRQEESRILLVAVPYALKAADAETLGGKPATAFVASDQLKEQVQSEVTAQVTQSATGQSTRTLVGTAPTPQVIAETSPATFTCATSGICVQSTQSGAGGIALRAATGSATGTAGIFDNLGGGKILSGRTTSYAEKFYVDGSGNLWAGGSLTANSFSGTSGAAVFGVATAGSGTAYGVRGQSASPSGTGVFGYATSPTGLTYGLLGSNLSASGTGLSGSASSPTGVTIGVRAVVQSPNGTAAIFDNLGGGKLISARTTGYAEKFSVSAAGNVVAAGSVTATSLNAALLQGNFGIFNNGSGPVVQASMGSVYGHLGTTYESRAIGVLGYSVVGGLGGIGARGHGDFAGVYGTAQGATGRGVAGFSTQYSSNGELGTSKDGNPVGALGSATGLNGRGVYGEGYTHGVYGTSLNGNGVYGTGPAAGVAGTGTTFGIGVRGDTAAGYGVYGIGDNGVRGECSSGDGCTGVVGVGGSSGVGVYGASSGGYGLYSEGATGASGTKSAVVALADDRVVELYSMESPEVWFEDFGSAVMTNGIAHVMLEPTFEQTVNTESNYYVFLTPNGETKGLYVAQKTPNGFQIREANGGRSNVAVDYRIVARRRGFENVRLQEVDADAEAVAAVRAQNHARPGRPMLRNPKKLAVPHAPSGQAKVEARGPSPEVQPR